MDLLQNLHFRNGTNPPIRIHTFFRFLQRLQSYKNLKKHEKKMLFFRFCYQKVQLFSQKTAFLTSKTSFFSLQNDFLLYFLNKNYFFVSFLEVFKKSANFVPANISQRAFLRIHSQNMTNVASNSTMQTKGKQIATTQVQNVRREQMKKEMI